MKHILTLILTAFALTVFAQHDTPIRDYRLQVGDFSRLNVVDGINVEYTAMPDTGGVASFSTTHPLASQILFTNNGKGELKIELAMPDDPTHPLSGIPTVHVSSRALTRVQNSGDSTVWVLNPPQVQEFKAVLMDNGRLVLRNLICKKFSAAIKTGCGTIVASGRCSDEVLSNTGTGTIQADQMEAQNASCRFFGTGSTGVWVTGKLVVKGALKGRCYYRGSPASVKNYGMGVKVYPMQ